MTREEFLSLPPGVAMRILFDALDEETVRAIATAEKPEIPRAPKYDYAIYRQNGVQYASETDVRGLAFWRDRSQTSAGSGGRYAVQDAKNVENLNRWLAWREFFPNEAWSGERNRVELVAAPPSARPRVYPRNGGSQSQTPKQQGAPSTDDYFGTGGGKSSGGGYSDVDYGGDEEIPF